MVAPVLIPPVGRQKWADQPSLQGQDQWECVSKQNKTKGDSSKEWQLRLSSGIHTDAPKCHKHVQHSHTKPAGGIETEYPSKFWKLLWKSTTIPPNRLYWTEKCTKKASREHDQTVDRSKVNTIRSRTKANTLCITHRKTHTETTRSCQLSPIRLAEVEPSTTLLIRREKKCSSAGWSMAWYTLYWGT